MEKISRLELCYKNGQDADGHWDLKFYTEEYKPKNIICKIIEYEIQDNGKTLKVWINE